MSYMGLLEYYKTIFALVQHHKYSLSDVYSMYPYERDIFLNLLIEHMREKEQENG
jgi:hypothetical protein